MQAGRLVNPGFTFERLHRGSDVSIDRTFLFNVLALITMPIRTDLEKRRFELTQGLVTMRTLQVAADTRQAWVSAVGAQETAKYMQQVKEAAEASAELARRCSGGNFSSSTRHASRCSTPQATDAARPRQPGSDAEREQLTRLMGLWGRTSASSCRSACPTSPRPRARSSTWKRSPETTSRRAGRNEGSREHRRLDGPRQSDRLYQRARVGYRRNSETGRARQTGYEIELRLRFSTGAAPRSPARSTPICRR